MSVAMPVSVPGDVDLVPRSSGTDQLLQAISPVDRRIIWISGHGGIWGRSEDGGLTWKTAVVEGAADLQFRDVHGIDAKVAYLLSAGEGEASRIYKTTDGGATWKLQFRNHEPEAFFDCFDFWDAENGIAFSDSVGGQTRLLRTEDGGQSWHRVADANLPPALPGEGSFAASGTCVITGPGGSAWIGTGAAATARVLRTNDWGRTWTAVDVPVYAGPSAGLASLAFRDRDHGVAFGGDISAPDRTVPNVAITSDGGLTWSPGEPPPFTGAVYGSAWSPDGSVLFVVGPNGIAYSRDGAHVWVQIETVSHWAIAFASAAKGWAVGPEGRITEIILRQATPQSATTIITAEQLLEWVNDDQELLILDVRTPEEFATGHVPGAVNIPHTEIEARLQEVRRAGDVDVVVYCRSGRRAGIAEMILREAGFRRLLHLEGDMLGWLEENLPVETAEPQS